MQYDHEDDTLGWSTFKINPQVDISRLNLKKKLFEYEFLHQAILQTIYLTDKFFEKVCNIQMVYVKWQKQKQISLCLLFG